MYGCILYKLTDCLCVQDREAEWLSGMQREALLDQKYEEAVKERAKLEAHRLIERANWTSARREQARLIEEKQARDAQELEVRQGIKRGCTGARVEPHLLLDCDDGEDKRRSRFGDQDGRIFT
jgi:cytochrome c-type biogenesis protein CcmH/NrfG